MLTQATALSFIASNCSDVCDAPPLWHDQIMTYRVEFRQAGAVIGEADGLQDRASAKQLAQIQIAVRDADIAIVIDVEGTGTEVASIRRDTMVWDDE